MTNLTIRPYQASDLDPIREMFIAWNRSIAPPGQETKFEAYIARSLEEELERIPDYYAPEGWGFWVVEADGQVVGCYGFEGVGDGEVEIRRMYVASSHRRRGIGRAMMADAEARARTMGYGRIVLSTSALQPQAKALYEASGYVLLREEAARELTNRTVGGGITRYYFEKPLH